MHGIAQNAEWYKLAWGFPFGEFNPWYSNPMHGFDKHGVRLPMNHMVGFPIPCMVMPSTVHVLAMKKTNPIHGFLE